MSQFIPNDATQSIRAKKARNSVMGVGLMHDLVRSFDWASTPLGHIDRWSDTLISNVNQVLFSPIPAILSWGPDFTFFYNEAAIPALQGKHPHALGASYRDVYKEIWDLVGPDLEDCFYRGKTIIRENMLIPLLNNGALQNGYFTYYLTPVFEEGRIAGIYDVYQNTTETLLARHERDAAASRLGQFLSATTDAVIGINRDWTISYANPEALKTYSPGRSMLGRNLWEQFPEAVYEGSPYIEHYTRAMNDGIASSFEAHYPDPVNIWLQLQVYPTPDGIVTFSRNISAHKRAEATLLVNERLAAVGRLASSIAHEINNPLESVTNLLYLARNSRDLHSIHSFLDQADDELSRISVIANQTLRFHKQSPVPKDVQCETLLSGVLSLLEGKIRNSSIRIDKRDRARTSVLIFESEIRQVLSNLAVNAIDAMQPGGCLHLRSRDATHWPTGRRGIMLTIADTGSGISAPNLKRIFEPFYTTKEMGGTGLGLWVSKNIVDRHHGQLRIRSSQSQLHSGTVIQLFLPHTPPHSNPRNTSTLHIPSPHR